MITLKHGMLLVVALLGLPLSQLDACSIAVVCTHNGFEAAKKFTVTISHAGKPLKGVLIEVIPDDGVNISKITETVGVVQFDDLLPGKYHISVSMLGISSVYECFHVSNWTTGLNAKHSLTYSWGDDGIETRQIAGKLVSRVLSANGQNPKTVSIAEIHLTLTDPVTGVQYETTSSPEGVFLFSGIAEGAYVLHSDGDKRFRYYPGDVLIHLERSIVRTELVFQLGGGGGDCRASLELLN
jgi:hypothetical protein